MTLLGRYELVRPIAKGGMATVYLARVVGEGGFERLVALKLMHPHIANDPDFVSMFLDEARLAARIRHPNVVPTLAVERSNDGLFLVMEFVDGHPLQGVIRTLARERRTFPTDIALRVMIDTLEGLHAAHELADENGEPLRLVHRDVSPHNVLLGKDGVSRITDFGGAHARARLTSTEGASLKGKVAYLSPEQITTGAMDRRADLFAAGIVMWEMLALRRLFRGETEGQTLGMILQGARQAPHQVRPDVPELVSRVCMKALAVDPNARFQTALEMIEALEAAAAAAGISVAKPRAVGAFVSELPVPTPSVDGSKLPSSSGISTLGRAAMPSAASAEMPMVASTPAPLPRRRGAWVALGVVAVLAVAAVGIAAAMRSPVSAGPAAAAPSELPLPPPSASAEPAPAASPVASAEPEEPGPVESAAPSSAEPEPEVAAPHAKPTMVKKAPPKSPNTSRPKGGAGYRPDEL
jgi:serine/threonine protein kinase